MANLSGSLVAYLFRWLPHSAPTGLFKVGEPAKDSPVVVSGNFSLTIKRVKKKLEGLDMWLLVSNTDGINVWCAAGGGIFTENRVIDAVKISALAEKVDHRELILPALCAPGIDCKEIKKQTGFVARFGPVYAKDIAAYLKTNRKKNEQMRLFRFGLKHRLDMLLSMNFPIYLLGALILAAFAWQYLLSYTIVFCSAVTFIYLFLDFIPGKTGWGQALFCYIAVLLSWAGRDWYMLGNPLYHWGWLLTTFAIFIAIGFDLAGIASARKSDAECLMLRLGFTKFASLFQKKSLGSIELDGDRCIGCKKCLDICPVGVYAGLNDKKITFACRNACFACGACVKQCPAKALSLV